LCAIWPLVVLQSIKINNLIIDSITTSDETALKNLPSHIRSQQKVIIVDADPTFSNFLHKKSGRARKGVAN
jgi:hypothetical protein